MGSSYDCFSGKETLVHFQCQLKSVGSRKLIMKVMKQVAGQ